jgi:hypothetical protein
MIYTNEVVMLILGLGVFWFVMLNKYKIRRIPAWKLLLFAFYFLMGGWFFTVIEGFILLPFFNLLEHVSYSVSAIIMAVWCHKIAHPKIEEASE